MIIEKNVICLACPFACRIKVTMDEEGNVQNIEGNECNNGKKYAENEVKNPVRLLTTTVRVMRNKDVYSLLPVQTDKPIDKNIVIDCVKKLAEVVLKPPIRYREVIYENILNTGADVISNFEIIDKK